MQKPISKPISKYINFLKLYFHFTTEPFNNFGPGGNERFACEGRRQENLRKQIVVRCAGDMSTTPLKASLSL